MQLLCEVRFGYKGSFGDNFGLLALKRTDYSSTDILKGRVHNIQDDYRGVKKVAMSIVMYIILELR